MKNGINHASVEIKFGTEFTHALCYCPFLDAWRGTWIRSILPAERASVNDL